MEEKKRKKGKDQIGEASRNKDSFVLPPSGLAEDIMPTLSSGAERAPSGENKGVVAASPSDSKENPSKSQKFVTFYLGQEEYGLPIFRVQEINRVGDITHVPNSPDYVRGVINLRGKIIPVIDLNNRFKIGNTQVGAKSRIVVVEQGPKLLGLMVDQVSQVVSISSPEVEEAPEEVKIEDNLIEGVAKLESKRLVILLNLDRILAKPS